MKKTKYVQLLDKHDISYLSRSVFGLRHYTDSSIRLVTSNPYTLEVFIAKTPQKIGQEEREEYHFGYKDFALPVCYSDIMPTEFDKNRISREFYSYMIRKFGKAYLCDLVEERYHVYPEVLDFCFQQENDHKDGNADA